MIPELTPAEIRRFYSKIRIGGCGLVWAGGEVHKFGYGLFPIYRNGKRKRISAHRLMFKLSTGCDPGPAVVRHGCDTPPCLTPDCLVAGTQADNMRDAVQRRRLNTGALTEYCRARDARVTERLAIGEKQCSHCWQVKQLEQDFYRCRANPDGRSYWCKTCSLDHQRDYRRAKSERERREIVRQRRQVRAA